MSDKANKNPWGGRFSSGMDPRVVAFTESVSFEQELCPFDIQGSVAHAEMLAHVGLLTESEKDTIVGGLVEILREIQAGKFKFRPELEDIHMNVERTLTEKIGEVAGKLHTGRSRNDQVSLDMRLWARDQTDKINVKLINLQAALVNQAGKYAGAVMPGYTHLQRAQPVSCGHWLLAYAEMFQRDRDRLIDTRKRINVLPLGSCAMAGTSLPLDRRYTAKLLGFDEITANSMDTSADRDFLLEFTFDLTTIALHLSRFAEDMIIYASAEFGFLKIEDGFCTGSSIMPQKKNPDVLELIRGKTSHAVGCLNGLMTLVKGLPMTYNRDMQEDKAMVFPTTRQVVACVDMTTVLLEHCSFDTEKMLEACENDHMDATSLAEFLAARGVPFRQAHHIVGALVQRAEEKGCRLADLSSEEVKVLHALLNAEARSRLGAKGAVSTYVTEGSGNPKLVRQVVNGWRKRLDEEKAKLAEAAKLKQPEPPKAKDSSEESGWSPADLS